MLDSVASPCARDGLAATLRSGLPGGYDGAGAWLLALRQRLGVRGDHGGYVEVDGTFLRDDAAAFSLVLHHVFGARHIIDQDAVS